MTPEELINIAIGPVHTSQGVCNHDRGILSEQNNREYFFCDTCGYEEEL